MSRAFTDVVEAQRIPTLVRLDTNFYALAYRLMKMVPARHILRQARVSGDLGPGTTVVETTSGTFGLALAMQCALDNQPLILVSDPVIDSRLRRKLEDLGAAVDIVRDPRDAAQHLLPGAVLQPGQPGVLRARRRAVDQRAGPDRLPGRPGGFRRLDVRHHWLSAAGQP
jgi:cysteine synthase